jgi:hypothetical protein
MLTEKKDILRRGPKLRSPRILLIEQLSFILENTNNPGKAITPDRLFYAKTEALSLLQPYAEVPCIKSFFGDINIKKPNDVNNMPIAVIEKIHAESLLDLLSQNASAFLAEDEKMRNMDIRIIKASLRKKLLDLHNLYKSEEITDKEDAELRLKSSILSHLQMLVGHKDVLAPQINGFFGEDDIYKKRIIASKEHKILISKITLQGIWAIISNSAEKEVDTERHIWKSFNENGKILSLKKMLGISKTIILKDANIDNIMLKLESGLLAISEPMLHHILEIIRDLGECEPRRQAVLDKIEGTIRVVIQRKKKGG